MRPLAPFLCSAGIGEFHVEKTTALRKQPAAPERPPAQHSPCCEAHLPRGSAGSPPSSSFLSPRRRPNQLFASRALPVLSAGHVTRSWLPVTGKALLGKGGSRTAVLSWRKGTGAATCPLLPAWKEGAMLGAHEADAQPGGPGQQTCRGSTEPTASPSLPLGLQTRTRGSLSLQPDRAGWGGIREPGALDTNRVPSCF